MVATGIVLEPVVPSGLEPIPVADGLFGIGRDTLKLPDPATTAGLARQHAYLFREQDGFHLMAIEGETTHNGRPLAAKQPVELKPGDEIGFAGTLSFRIAAGKPDSARPAALQVSLIPAEDSVSKETIVLESLPFLVSREAVLFREYETTMPSTVRALSRRHAFLYTRDGNLYVKDLGSTNGTWVGDQHLEPYTEVPVHAGETISFGSMLLSYTVQLERLDAEELTRTLELRTAGIPDATSGMHRIDKTVYIRTADSFLDIFLAQPASKAAEAATVPRKPAAKPMTLLRGLRDALSEDGQPRRRRPGLVWGAAAGLVLIAGLGYYLYDTPHREIAALLKQERYQAGLVRAGEVRDRYPGDAELETLATEALSRWLVSDWQQSLEAGEFTAADALLGDVRSRGPLYPESERILELLAWMGDLERFMVERGGSTAPLVLFRDEPTVSSLLQRWDADASGFDLLLVKIAQHVPAFQEQRARVLSQLRSLRNDQTVYLQALHELRRDLNRQLAAGDTDEAMLQVARFERQYPRITGLAALGADIARVESLQQALAAGDLDALLVLRDADFATPWVRELAAEALWPQLPAPTTLERYAQALDAWGSGDTRQAIDLLRELADTGDGHYVAATLAHFEHVAGILKLLPSARQQADFGAQLLVFAQTLDRDRDRYFLDLLSDDLAQQRTTLLADLEILTEQARAYWSAYRDSGGISGLMRLEETVSEPFRTQSQRLHAAYQAIDETLQGYVLLHQPPSETVRQLHGAILGEVRLQRQSFTDLSLVLEPVLLRDKLRLLPEPEES